MYAIRSYYDYYFGPYQHIATRFAQSSATATFSPLDTGRYYVLIQDNNGDFAQGTFTIHEPATLAGGTLTLENVITSYSIHYTKLYEVDTDPGKHHRGTHVPVHRYGSLYGNLARGYLV